MNSKRDYQYLELFRNKFLIYKYSPLCIMSDFLEHTGFTGLMSFDCPTCCLSRGLFYFIFLLGIADGLYGNYTTWWHLWCFFFTALRGLYGNYTTWWPLWEFFSAALCGLYGNYTTWWPIWEFFFAALRGLYGNCTTWWPLWKFFFAALRGLYGNFFTICGLHGNFFLRLAAFMEIFLTIVGLYGNFFLHFCCPQDLRVSQGCPHASSKGEVGSGMPSHPRHPGGRFTRVDKVHLPLT